MDVAGSRRFSREASPERVKATAVARVRPAGVTRPFRRVQVVYYLTRNGHLEHPHYMEVTHMANQQLRLKDVMDRLTLLRGKGMPSLYSWSCKRSYKNGYVWNDLTENDPIYPAEGAEYVLKGSELIRGCTERFEQLQVSSIRHQIPEPTFLPKAKPIQPLITSSSIMNPRTTLSRYTDDRFEEDEEEEKTSGYTSSSNVNTPFSLSSKGVSTEDIMDVGPHKNRTELVIALDGESPPPSTSSASSDKATEPGGVATSTPTPTPGSSKRFGSGNASEGVVAPLLLSRNSVLLHLISCGRASCSKKKRGVLAAGERVDEEEDEDEEEIRCMSMNPRFGRAEAAEKEYFSGSIAEAMMEGRVATEPTLKKSSSYNEERSAAAALPADTAAVAAKDDNHQHHHQRKPVKVKCIPRKKLSSHSSSTKQSSKK